MTGRIACRHPPSGQWQPGFRHPPLALAYLALADDPASAAAQRSVPRAAVALIAALVLALAAPLAWVVGGTRRAHDTPAATAVKGGHAEDADDDDGGDDGGGPVGGHERVTVPGAAATRDAIGSLATVSEAPPWESRSASGRPGGSRGRRDRAGPHRAAVAGRRPPLRGVPGLGRPPARGAGGQAAAARAGGRSRGVRELAARPRRWTGSRTRCWCAAMRGRRRPLPAPADRAPRGPDAARADRPRRRLPLEQLLPLGLHVASALHYLAAEGIVHLNVKPDNVVMGAPPRLIDLSVARTVQPRERCGGRSGRTAT